MLTDPEEVAHLAKLLSVFFSLPYSTDLDGKDAESLLRIVKGAEGPISRRKELFDIVTGDVGYSVKTLAKRPAATRVDLQEQRFCDNEGMDAVILAGGDVNKQGEVLLAYIRNRINESMQERGIKVGLSSILLKHWDPTRTNFEFRYWEEDFQGWIEDLWQRHHAGELTWVRQGAGLHGQDATRDNIRLIRMHHKHNQIFTDHDIPSDAVKISFKASPIGWDSLYQMMLEVRGEGAEEVVVEVQADVSVAE